ncbi:ABC transporter permease [Sulfurimonas sp. SAG-AH-194-I05]|nr:ABC transporter permease [Sulfurimonas sp. SAG-AH-194-I05]MDF1874740.1 ABC transporter permease [Sulfurimonas sp. SAG-AH-194-I05]
MLRRLIKHIYHTSLTVLPLFVFLASIFGSLIIGFVIVMATQLNMQVELGSLIVTFVVTAFSPFFTIVFIYIRYITFINKKITQSTNEIIIQKFLLAYLLGGIFSSIALASIFSVIMLVSAYLFTFFFMGMDIHSYKFIIFDAIKIQTLLLFLSKASLFGFIAMSIPLYIKLESNETARKSAPIHMIIPFLLALFFIEMVSFTFQSLF